MTSKMKEIKLTYKVRTCTAWSVASLRLGRSPIVILFCLIYVPNTANGSHLTYKCNKVLLEKTKYSKNHFFKLTLLFLFHKIRSTKKKHKQKQKGR